MINDEWESMFERLIPSPSPEEKGAEKRIKCEFVGSGVPRLGD